MSIDIENLTDEELDELAPTKPKKSQADKLVELVNGAELFHQDIDEPFASVVSRNCLDITISALASTARAFMVESVAPSGQQVPELYPVN